MAAAAVGLERVVYCRRGVPIDLCRRRDSLGGATVNAALIRYTATSRDGLAFAALTAPADLGAAAETYRAKASSN